MFFSRFKKKARRRQGYGCCAEQEFREDLDLHIPDEEVSLLRQYERGYIITTNPLSAASMAAGFFGFETLPIQAAWPITSQVVR